jgi:dolichol-phosphate mannosyltransferase
MNNRALFVLLPAYNEENSLEQLLDKIIATCEELGVPFRIVVCNDGSRDTTAAILSRRSAADARIDVLTHKINRGLGETVRDLFEYAAELVKDDDIVIRLDCDDTHEPKHMPAMISKLDSGCDVVIASRFAEGGTQYGVNAYRAFISKCANLFMRVFFAIPNVQEYSCGFRAYRGALIRHAVAFYGNDLIQLRGLGFTCTLEKLVKLHLLRARFGEIGFALRYDQKLSESKMVGSITTLGYLLMALLYHWPWGGWRRFYRKKLADKAGGRAEAR